MLMEVDSSYHIWIDVSVRRGYVLFDALVYIIYIKVLFFSGVYSEKKLLNFLK